MILTHPISGRETHAEAAEWLPGCAYFRCPKTGLEWLDPVPENAPVFPDFSVYADGLLAGAAPGIIGALLEPNERAALAWTHANVARGARIVELFAETGRFAWQLRSEGYDVRLADPLASHVAVLRKHGFTAQQSASPEDLPASWADADAVIILESIVRSPRPAALMAALRARFPRAQVFLTAPSMRRPLKLPGVDRRTGYPPDFLTRWTVAALRELLAAHGYAARGRAVTPRLLASAGRRGWRGKIYLALMVLLMRMSREYEFSVSAWGRPRSPES